MERKTQAKKGAPAKTGADKDGIYWLINTRNSAVHKIEKHKPMKIGTSQTGENRNRQKWETPPVLQPSPRSINEAASTGEPDKTKFDEPWPVCCKNRKRLGLLQQISKQIAQYMSTCMCYIYVHLCIYICIYALHRVLRTAEGTHWCNGNSTSLRSCWKHESLWGMYDPLSCGYVVYVSTYT